MHAMQIVDDNSKYTIFSRVYICIMRKKTFIGKCIYKTFAVEFPSKCN